ncbi:hypothetical protein AMECASPLE_026928 [Ameca splendens]|uniref:Uncharacterized protein n=1 Tax=Ameca splendens TaxID=208324 RepID=A0ABV0ZR95_9TELE
MKNHTVKGLNTINLHPPFPIVTSQCKVVCAAHGSYILFARHILYASPWREGRRNLSNVYTCVCACVSSGRKRRQTSCYRWRTAGQLSLQWRKDNCIDYFLIHLVYPPQ